MTRFWDTPFLGITYFEIYVKRFFIMAINAQQKSEIITQFQRDKLDTGSSEVQVALLTARIKDLTEHFKTHVKDHHSRRGLLKLVSRRRRLLDYLKRTDVEKYNNIIKTLGLRK